MSSFVDDFNRPDAGTLGSGWDEYTNGFHIVSGAAVADTTATNAAARNLGLATGDISISMEIGNVYGGSFTGVCARMPDTIGTSGATTGPFYLLVMSGSTGTAFSIRRKENNSTTLTTLATGNSATDARVDGSVWRLDVFADPANPAQTLLRGYHNDALVVSASDSSGTVPDTQRRGGIYASGATSVDLRVARVFGQDIVTAPTDTTPPTVPGSVTAAAATTSSVDVAWAPSTDATGVASYRVRRDGTDVAAAVTGTSYTDTGVPAGEHSYTVSAVDGAGNRSAESAPATVTLTPPDTTPPPVPTGLTATAGVGSVALSWTAVTAPDLVGYRVRRGGTVIASPTGTSYTDTGVTAGTGYSYTVAAYDQAGNESAGSTAAAATPTAPASGSTGPTVAWWDGSSEAAATVDGVWTGSSIQPATIQTA